MKNEIKGLEEIANNEATSIPERLHVIYKLYRLYGIRNPYLEEVGKD